MGSTAVGRAGPVAPTAAAGRGRAVAGRARGHVHGRVQLGVVVDRALECRELFVLKGRGV